MAKWAEVELKSLDLGDGRLNKRAVKLVEALAARPESSVPQACGGWGETKAAYRFWDNEQVTVKALLKAHQDATVKRLLGQPQVLVLQDTTSFDYSHHPATTGLGSLDHASCLGIKVHSALAVTVEGVPLGLVHQEMWVRTTPAGQLSPRRKRATSEKESQRWLTSLTKLEQAIPAEIETLLIGDRESDIYDLFHSKRRVGSHWLIRAAQNRAVTDEAGYLWPTLALAPVEDWRDISVQPQPNQPARVAHLALRYQTITLKPPRHAKKEQALQPLTVTAIWVNEENPPLGATPLSWMLLTTLSLENSAQAWQVVQWYAYRWLIERYHFVLKSGCRLEQLQLESADRLQRAIATYCLVAWRLLWLTYEARCQPDQPCTVAFEPFEWQALFATLHPNSPLPTTPPTLAVVVRWVAQLGGFLARRHDGEPGVATLWRGLRRLHDIAHTWLLATHNLPPLTCG
jgi:hypothetical protein